MMAEDMIGRHVVDRLTGRYGLASSVRTRGSKKGDKRVLVRWTHKNRRPITPYTVLRYCEGLELAD